MWKFTKLFVSFLKPSVIFEVQLSCIFLLQALQTFCKSDLLKCRFPDFTLLVIKFTKFLVLFFKQNFFLQSLDHSSVSSEILHFLAETLYAIGKSSTSKCKFSDLPWNALKYIKWNISLSIYLYILKYIFMTFLESRASFS